MSAQKELSASDIQGFKTDVTTLLDTLNRVIVGQNAVVEQLVTAIFAGGHTLIEGLPGLGKTHLAKALAKSIGLELARVQCTPDLMPADITGSEILIHDRDRPQRLDFQPGPIFSNMLLIDEINRASPKTQAAFLEAMQEGQVTYAGKRHLLPAPFWVIATQNPIELEGTYPLPEAQLDRFIFKLTVNYPQADALLSLADKTLDDEPADHIAPVLPLARVNEMIAQTREVVIASAIKQAAIALVLATQSPPVVNNSARHNPVRYGASPRGLQALLRSARVRALSNGRGHVAIEDIEAVALPSLRHRILLTMESEIDGIDVDTLLTEMVREWSARQR